MQADECRLPCLLLPLLELLRAVLELYARLLGSLVNRFASIKITTRQAASSSNSFELTISSSFASAWRISS